MRTILKYILLTGLRDKLYLGIFITLILAFSLAIFLGSTSFVEAPQATLTYVAGTSRAIIIVGMILFTCLSINRAFANKEIEFMLTKPLSREQFIFSYLIGFSLTTALILLPLAAVFFILAKVNLIGILIWFFSLFVETLMVISFAFLTSLILKNSFSSILASLAFYLISRLMGIFVLVINLPQDFTQFKSNFLPSMLKIISLIFPRLDLFTQSSWMVYGVEDFSIIKLIAAQGLIYVTLVVFMAFFDFRRKEI